jgi:nicotinate phosphoribosyltransferase
MDLLAPIFRKGELVYQIPDIRESREHARKQLGCLPPEVLTLGHPQAYRVGLENSLHELRSGLIARAKEQST